MRFLIFLVSSFFLSSLPCFAATSLTGEWVEKKIEIYIKELGTYLGTERMICIDSDFIIITNYEKFEKTESTKYMYSLDEDNLLVNINDGRTIKIIDENMILLYDDRNFTPSLFIRKGHDISILEKNVRGTWVYKEKNKYLNKKFVYQFRRNRLVITRTDHIIQRDITDEMKWVAPYAANYRDHPNVYSVMGIGYEARLLNDDFAVLYTHHPPGTERDITVLVKIR